VHVCALLCCHGCHTVCACKSSYSCMCVQIILIPAYPALVIIFHFSFSESGDSRDEDHSTCHCRQTLTCQQVSIIRKVGLYASCVSVSDYACVRVCDQKLKQRKKRTIQAQLNQAARTSNLHRIWRKYESHQT